MRLWERIAIRGNREVYYYDTKQSFEAEEFASRLYDLICMERKNGGGCVSVYRDRPFHG